MVVEAHNLCHDLLLPASARCGCAGSLAAENEELHRGSGRDSFGCLSVMRVSCSHNIIPITVYGLPTLNGQIK